MFTDPRETFVLGLVIAALVWLIQIALTRILKKTDDDLPKAEFDSFKKQVESDLMIVKGDLEKMLSSWNCSCEKFRAACAKYHGDKYETQDKLFATLFTKVDSVNTQIKTISEVMFEIKGALKAKKILGGE